MRLAIIIPVYGHFKIASRAILSAWRQTSLLDPLLIIVDDASPVSPEYKYFADAISQIPDEQKNLILFERNGGLTRSWNAGLTAAKALGAEYACCANSDLIFSHKWEDSLVTSLNNGSDLVGPITNAPGTEELQNVRRYISYEPSDAQKKINEVGEQLKSQFGTQIVATTLNGFCMVAKTKTWWNHSFDAEHVFCPRNDFDSKGRPNPTPLMTLNEYELQRRWHKVGLKSSACLGSFVFHYRSVSRGRRFGRGQEYRPEGE